MLHNSFLLVVSIERKYPNIPIECMYVCYLAFVFFFVWSYSKKSRKKRKKIITKKPTGFSKWKDESFYRLCWGLIWWAMMRYLCSLVDDPLHLWEWWCLDRKVSVRKLGQQMTVCNESTICMIVSMDNMNKLHLLSFLPLHLLFPIHTKPN